MQFIPTEIIFGKIWSFGFSNNMIRKWSIGFIRYLFTTHDLQLTIYDRDWAIVQFAGRKIPAFGEVQDTVDAAVVGYHKGPATQQIR